MANVDPSYGQSPGTHGARSVAAALMGKDFAIEHQVMGVVDDQLKNIVVVPQVVEVPPFSCFAGGILASFEMVSVVEVQK